MEGDVLVLIFRWIHMLSAMAAVGGMIFQRFALLPATEESLEPEQAQRLQDSIRLRWSKLVITSIGLLLISGLVNFTRIVMTTNLPPMYHMVFGIKFLLAMGIFFLSSALVGNKAALAGIRKNARLWLLVNIGLAVVLVCLSGVLKFTPHTPKSSSSATDTAQAE